MSNDVTDNQLLIESQKALKGLICLVKAMTEEERDYYIKTNMKWWETGHGQYAQEIMKKLESHNG